MTNLIIWDVYRFKAYLNKPLYKGSFYITLTSFFNAVFGLLFWFTAAKLYTSVELGYATAMISAMSLLDLLSKLGFDQYIIRFLPEDNRDMVISNSIVLVFASSLILGIFSVLFWAELFKGTILFLLCLLSSSLISITSNIFIAMRRSDLYFLQNLILGARIILLFLLVPLGSLGIFSSMGMSFLLALVISFYFLWKMNITFNFNLRPILKADIIFFLLGNYLTTVLMLAPSQVLPILVFKVLGPENTAYYYIAYSITSLLLIVPYAISTSMFVEGSYGEHMSKIFRQSILIIILILLPITLLFLFFSGSILELVGGNYMGAEEVMQIMIPSTIFISIYLVYISMDKIMKNNRNIISVSGFAFISLVGMSYIFMNDFGLIGIGYAWFLSYGFCVILAYMLHKDINSDIKREIYV